MRFLVCELIFTYAQSRICGILAGNPNRVGKIYFNELAGAETYLHRKLSQLRQLAIVYNGAVLFNTEDMQIVFSDTPGFEAQL